MRDELRAKRRPKTDLDRLNELIDWYNAWKPEAGKIIAVRFTSEQLNEFATRIAGTNQWRYRDRILERQTNGNQTQARA